MSAERIAAPFHEGERYIQQRAGESRFADRNAAMVRNRILPGALPFLHEQSMAVVSSEDQSGNLWCSLLFGSPGFLRSDDGSTVAIDLRQTVRNPADPLWRNFEAGGRAGLLVIELATRRRLRINGVIRPPQNHKLLLEVTESYPNCPKYITRRQVSAPLLQVPKLAPASGEALGSDQQSTVRQADLLFIASANPVRGLDASHRGGNPGFVEVNDSRTLLIPDYPGNSMFNTLGNLNTNPHAGLAIPDFPRSRLLQLTGTAEVVWNESERHLVFRIERWIELPLPEGMHAETLDYSPFNP